MRNKAIRVVIKIAPFHWTKFYRLSKAGNILPFNIQQKRTMGSQCTKLGGNRGQNFNGIKAVKKKLITEKQIVVLKG